jgi:hypothetical protein
MKIDAWKCEICHKVKTDPPKYIIQSKSGAYPSCEIRQWEEYRSGKEACELNCACTAVRLWAGDLVRQELEEREPEIIDEKAIGLQGIQAQ